MSSSISFGTSTDQETLVSSDGSFGFAAEFDPQLNRLTIGLERYEKEPDVGGTSKRYHFLTKDASGTPNLVRWDSRIYEGRRQQVVANETRLSTNRGKAAAKIGGQITPRANSEDFYHEVDERMSLNSLEYPLHQKTDNTVAHWLKENKDGPDLAQSGLDPSDRDNLKRETTNLSRGNVIGIRGFPSDRMIEENNRQRASYNKLKLEHLKLQSEYRKLRAKLGRLEDEFRRVIKRKDGDVDILGALIEKYTRSTPDVRSDQHDEANTKESQENVDGLALRRELRLLEHRMDVEREKYETQLDKSKRENLKLHEQVEECNREISSLSNQIKALKLQPEQRTIIELKNEIDRLRCKDEANTDELEVLRESYAKLEMELKSMAKDQRCLDDYRNDEVSKIFTELCRLQVYQPKLEMTLKTEREIKNELQRQLIDLEARNAKSVEEINSLKMSLSNERLQSKKDESIEIKSLNSELARWQERYKRLQRDKLDADRLVQNLKYKLDQLDSKHQEELEQVRDISQKDISEANMTIVKLESIREELQMRLEQTEKQLRESNARIIEVDQQLHETSKKFETEKMNRMKDAIESNRFQQLESQVKERNDELASANLKINELSNDLSSSRQQEARFKQQAEELYQRLQLQQKTIDELRVKKDNEMAKLRLDLNYERYNRQVALQHIERELKSSFRELETMKCKFTNRLSSPNSSIRAGESAGKPKCRRKLEFCLDKNIPIEPQQ